MQKRRKAGIAAVGGVLLASTALAGTASAAPAGDDVSARAIECETEASGEQAEFYHGPSASYAYDERFSDGPTIPNLPEFIPQGATTWENWDGNDNDVLLVTSYLDGQKSRIGAIDIATGDTVGSVEVAESHVGGIAVVNGWAFVSGNGDEVRKYDLTELAEALKSGDTPTLEQVGSPQPVHAASFLSFHGDTLYAGKFNALGRGKMYDYKVAEDGSLTEGKEYEVPKKTQGLMVTDDHFVYSTSYGRTPRGNVYIVDHGATDIDVPSTYCFRAPSMAEGITKHDGDAYLAYESGADKYSEVARNVITTMHKAPISELVKRP